MGAETVSLAGKEIAEATQGLAHMDIRQQEFRDMEVARRLQEEEMKASQLDKRAAQVAQDEVSGRFQDMAKPCFTIVQATLMLLVIKRVWSVNKTP
uniref:Uncharacterized protein n=1 Tax=Electrophorus electricus TaxID=8005 RepID=A0A4W4FMM0_ELEEL